MAHNRRPTNNNNNENDFSAAGLQMPPSLASAGYQALRTSKDIQQPQQPQQLGEPMTFITDQGRYWSGTCYYVTIAILIALIIVGCIVTGVIVRHTALEHGDRVRCGDIQIQEGEWCGKYIIAGIGSTTSPTLRRLSTDPTKKILALEAGSDFSTDPEVNVVGNIFRFQQIWIDYPNKYHWMINGAGEPGLAGPQIYLGGRALSGGSQDNYMLMGRGTIAAHDDFDASVGSPGTFNGAAMSATFLELEYLNEHGHHTGDNLALRGDGTLPTQTWKIDVIPHVDATGFDQITLTNFFVSVLGVPDRRTQSYSAPGVDLGVFPYLEGLFDFDTSSPMLRWSGRKAFMDASVMDQTTYRGVAPRQFEVLINSTAEKLLFHNGRCVGVQYMGSDGVQRKAYVETDGEVILGMGIHSAALLQRSGIGPADVLAEAGVTPVLVNPHVGQHLKVQTVLQIPFLWPNITAIPTDPGLPNFIIMDVEDVSPLGTPGRRAFFDGVVTFPGAPGFGVFFMNDEFVLSEGSVNISSANPYTEVRMVANTYTNSDELEKMRYHLRYVVGGSVAEDPNFFPLSLDLVTLYDDTLLDAWIHANMGVQFHFFGTCRMGTDQSSSVVDNRFRVWGINGLRVCDLSAMQPFDAHPTTPAVAMGDICGRMVLEDAGSSFVAKAHRKEPSHTKNTQKKKTPTTRKEKRIFKQPDARQQPRLTDQEMWDAYQQAIETIRANYSPEAAQRMINGIYANPTYQRLAAQFAPQPPGKRSATHQQHHIKPSPLRR